MIKKSVGAELRGLATDCFLIGMLFVCVVVQSVRGDVPWALLSLLGMLGLTWVARIRYSALMAKLALLELELAAWSFRDHHEEK